MNKLYTVLLALGASLYLINPLNAQIVVTNNNIGTQLAQTLAGSGVTITNVQFSCPNGGAGTFNCNNCNLGMSEGLVLTTGSAQLVGGPNNVGSQGVDALAAGDASLNNLAWPDPTFDACVLQFDMQVLSDSVEFKYIFASEEYLEWVGAGYNDIFAFFISGPGIAGQQNIALVPGTTTPVSIDNVNTFSYPQYYVDNGDGYSAPQNSSSYYIQYDGFTTVLTAKRGGLQACQTYHLKLAIADVGDGIYDSGVFLQANSLTSNGVQVDSPTTNIPNVSNAMEGCIDGRIRFTLVHPVNTPITVHYGIGGTAVNGTDYTHIADSIVIAAHDTEAYLTIHPITDGLVEGTETVSIYLYNQCNSQPYDSSVLLLIDSFGVKVSDDTTICAGASVQLHATGNFNYLWTPATWLTNNNFPDPTATPPQTVTYICTSNAGGCISKDSVTITVISSPFSVDAGPNITTCGGQSAQLGATVTGSPIAGNPFQYLWTPGTTLNDSTVTNPVATPTATTVYHILVSSGYCTAIDSVTVGIGNLAVNMAKTNQHCFNVNDGTATVNVINGQTPFTYHWNTGGTGAVANGLAPGTYYVSVNDNGNCSTVDSVTINPAPFIYFNTPTVNNLNCATANNGSISITASGGTGLFSYVWSTGSTSTLVYGLSANIPYSVTASDVNNCRIDTSITLTAPAPIVIALTTGNISCNGAGDGNVNSVVTGGVSPYTYTWSNSSSGPSITNLSAGNYTLSITDNNGCQQNATAIVTEPALLISGNPTITPVACYGGNTGAITAHPAGGTTPYNYNWSNSQQTATIAALIAGNYDLTVTDSSGCTATATYQVTEPASALSIANFTVTDPTCYGFTNGSINITAAGATPGYHYGWSNNATLDQPANNGIGTGNYAVTVTDANGCAITGAYAVNQPSPLAFTGVTSTNLNCYNVNDGTAAISAAGGTGNIDYLWSSGNTTNSINALNPGTYYVTATDANSCNIDTFVIITAPPALVVTINPTAVNCHGGNDGRAASTVTGGTPAYQYQWSNSGTGATITQLTANHYYLTVTDNNNCVVTDSVLITEPTQVRVTAAATSPLCPDGNDGVLVSQASGGISPYDYVLLVLNSTIQTNNTGVFRNLTPNTYTVAVNDAHSCPADTTVPLANPPQDVFRILPDTTSCYGSDYNDGTIEITPALQLNSPFTYSLDGGEQQYSGMFIDLSAGMHHLHMANINGCTVDTDVIVPEPAEGVASILPGDSMVQAGEQLNLYTGITNYNPIDIISYEWSPAEGLSCADCPNPVVSTYAAHTYTVTVRYYNNCVTTASTEVLVHGVPPVFIPNTFTPNGDGNNDVFYVYGSSIKTVHLQVFNRWGEKVFDSNNQFDGWDGTFKGIVQKPDVYVYTADITYLDDKQIKKNGSVTILR